jgi:hypothetical protein
VIKESFLEMAKRHQAGDMLVQGAWQTCSVGCFNRDYGNDPYDFAALARSTGYKEWTHRLQEKVFESLPEKYAKDWHVQFAEKMETVKDFDALYHSFMIGVLEVALPHDKYGVVQPVIDLHRDYQSATPEDWEEVADAARDAAEADAAWDAAWAAAWAAKDAARDAARAAAWDAEAAAWAVWAAARAAAWKDIRDAFLNADGGE